MTLVHALLFVDEYPTSRSTVHRSATIQAVCVSEQSKNGGILFKKSSSGIVSVIFNFFILLNPVTSFFRTELEAVVMELLRLGWMVN